MGAASEGMKLDLIFRTAFSIEESIDICDLMEAAIDVAVMEYPEEFSRRRERIFKKFIDHSTKDAVVVRKLEEEVVQKPHKNIIRIRIPKKCGTESNEESKIVEEEVAQKTDREIIRNQIHKNTGIVSNKQEKKFNSDDATARKGEGRKKMVSKLEDSRRKLHERYDQIEKRKRRIQMIAPTDLPKQPMFSCNGSGIGKRRCLRV